MSAASAVVLVVLVLILTSTAEAGTHADPPAEDDTVAPAESTSPGRTVAQRHADQQDKLDELVAKYLADHPGFDASVSISDGLTTLHYGKDGTYESASIAKLEILVRWLLIRQDGGLPEHEYRLAREMIVHSDNKATLELCRTITGDLPRTSVPGGTDVCVDSSLWGVQETTAADQVALVEAALGPWKLNPDSAQTARDLLSHVAVDQDWGISAAATESETVYLKNGWDYRDGWLNHSIGLIDGPRPIRIAVLTFGHDSFDTGVGHVEDLARLARQALDEG